MNASEMDYMPSEVSEFSEEVAEALVFLDDSVDGITIACYKNSYIPFIRIAIRLLLHAQPDRVLRDMVVYNRKAIRIVAIQGKIEDGHIKLEGYDDPIFFVGMNNWKDIASLEYSKVYARLDLSCIYLWQLAGLHHYQLVDELMKIENMSSADAIALVDMITDYRGIIC